ncbi:MAG TPA: thioredoxin family protein [Thermoanaerobaculia bacterium]|nr:thioredoxin family protein [Thermoanaerobaculia bacterium]
MQTFCLAALLALAAGAGEAQIRKPEKASFVLTADRTAYDAGSPAQVAALVTIDPGWHVNSHKPTFDYLIPTELDLVLPESWPAKTVQYQYPQAEMQTFAFADQPLAVYDGSVVIVGRLEVPAGTAQGPVPIRAKLRYQACNDSQCLPPVTTEAELQLKIAPGGKPQNEDLFGKAAAPGGGEEGPKAGAGGAGTASTAAMLLLAVLGGLILNAMPCVLPILSLKVFGLVKSAGHGRREVVSGALATAAGIFVSFWALAIAAIAARAAGAAVGWGVQFQRPGFVAFLAVVVVLFCLNLWGLFEIPLPQRLARLGGSGPREGLAGHFTSGLFATLMATPCSAPFLGTAVGFALSQKAALILAIFTAVGLGMALPYLLIASAPGIARVFPKPGAWMDTVRGAMGFLLAASAVWLFYVLASQVSPEQLAAIQLGLLALGLFTWLQHKVVNGRGLRGLAAAGVVAAAVITLVAATRQGEATGVNLAEKPTGLIQWTAFDRAQAESLSSGGQIVFVDVTADWCFTCKVNERLVLETPEVAQAFEEHKVLPMKADWTNRNDEIGKFLAEHGRYGIPFYLLYRPGQDPHVFSELLTKETLVAAVQKAGNEGCEPAQTC